jgi:hypothetical protein
MAIGTSDGSDFGGAGQGIDGPTSSHFCRFDLYHSERNVAIAVFPHSRNGGVRQQIEATARRAGLEPQYVWDGSSTEQSVLRILSADPWRENYSDMPEGYYSEATGETTYGAVCWKIPKKRGGQLEISYVTWRFYETADFSTSIVVKVVPPLYETPPELAELINAAKKIAGELTAWLQSAPQSTASVLLRQRLAG